MIAMSVQTSYFRPEEDPANWFTQSGDEGLEGPAVVTAMSAKEWFLEKDGKRKQFTASALLLGKLFLLPGWSLTGHRDAMVSGYRLPQQ